MNSENYLCPLCERYPDTQQHICQCQVLKDICPLSSSIEYSGLFGSVEEQKTFIEKYEAYLVLRDELLQDDPSSQPSLPGLYTGPQLPQDSAPARSSDSNPIWLYC